MTLHTLLRQKKNLSNASFAEVGVAQLVRAPVPCAVDHEFKPHGPKILFLNIMWKYTHMNNKVKRFINIGPKSRVSL